MPRRIRKTGEVLNLTNAKFEESSTRQHNSADKKYVSKAKAKGTPATRKSKAS